MKGIFVIIDGLGDLPNKRLEGKTPLEAAQTPNLDFLAARGILGYMYPVKPNFIPESDEAIVSIFGNDCLCRFFILSFPQNNDEIFFLLRHKFYFVAKSAYPVFPRTE